MTTQELSAVDLLTLKQALRWERHLLRLERTPVEDRIDTALTQALEGMVA